MQTELWLHYELLGHTGIPAQPWKESYDFPASYIQEFLHHDSWIAHVNNAPAIRMCQGTKITKDLISPLLIRNERVKENTSKHLNVPFQLYTDIFQLIWLILFKRAAGVINPYPLSWKGIFQQHRLQFLAICLRIQSLKFVLSQQMDFIKHCALIQIKQNQPLSQVSPSPRRNLQVWDFHMPKLITFSIHMGSWEVWDYLMSDYSTLCQHFYSEYKNSLNFLWKTWISKVKMYKTYIIP